MGAITGINKVIIELLKENNTEMEELAKYLKINKETLEKKLDKRQLIKWVFYMTRMGTGMFRYIAV